jgi:hypothetical protein
MEYEKKFDIKLNKNKRQIIIISLCSNFNFNLYVHCSKFKTLLYWARLENDCYKNWNILASIRTKPLTKCKWLPFLIIIWCVHIEIFYEKSQNNLIKNIKHYVLWMWVKSRIKWIMRWELSSKKVKHVFS